MPITRVAAGTSDYATNTTSFVLTLPAGVAAGDVVLFTVTTTTSTATTLSTTTSTGSLFGSGTGVGDAVQSQGWYYVIPSTVPSTITVSAAATRQGTLAWAIYRGVDPTTPIDAGPSALAQTVGSNTVGVMPSITTVTANAMIVGGTSHGSSSTTTTPPSPWTIIADGTRRNGLIYEKGVQASPGATGTANFTFSASQQHRMWVVALRPLAGPVEPSFLHTITGFSSSTSIRAKVKVANATSVRLKVATNTGLTTGVVFGTASTPDAQGYCEVEATGLSPWTQYYYGLEMTGATTVTTAQVGKAKTLPVAGTPTSFSIAFGSCNDYLNPPSVALNAFTNIDARNPDIFVHLGDFTYADNASTSQASHRTDLETTINYSSSMRTVLAGYNGIYTKSDHDAGPNNSFPGTQTPANRAAMLQVIPDLDCPDPNGLYGSRTVGRVKLIVLDTRYFSVQNGNTRLGAAQKTWLFNELSTSEPFKIIFMDSAWISNEPVEAGGDKWENFEAERQEIADFITNDAVGSVVVAHGDSHSVSADDGSHNPWGGFPTYCGGPFFNLSSIKTLNGAADWSQGAYPTVESTPASQYAMFVITDNGDDITLNYNGYDTNNTSRVAHTYVVEATPPQDFSGSVTLSGSGTLTQAGRPTVSSTRTLSGEGTLTRSGRVGASGTVNPTYPGPGTFPGENTFPGGSGLTGSGSLALSGRAGVAGSRALSGSGTLSLSGSAQQSASGSVALSGSGTLARAAAGVTASGSGALSGSGELDLAGTGTAEGDASLSGSGTLTLSGRPGVSRALALSGEGDLDAAVTDVDASGSLGRTGSGSLALSGDASESAAGSVNLSGSGTLSRVGGPSFTRSLGLSGSGEFETETSGVSARGSLSRTGTGTLAAGGEGETVGAGIIELEGSGTLTGTASGITATGVLALAGSGSLSASGEGTTEGEGSTSLGGSGQLMLSGRASVEGEVSTSGSGLLALSGATNVRGSLGTSGSGTLTLVGEGSSSGDGTLTLSGVGSLSVVATDVDTAGTLALSGAGTLVRQLVGLALSGELNLGGSGTLAAVRRGQTQIPETVKLTALPYTIELVAQESDHHIVVTDEDQDAHTMLIVKRGDTHEVSWKTNLDLTGATVRLMFRRRRKNSGEPLHSAVEADAFILNPAEGIVGHALTGELVVADYDVELEVTLDGVIVTAPNNDYETLRVEKDLL